jgi:hypothetical protein
VLLKLLAACAHSQPEIQIVISDLQINILNQWYTNLYLSPRYFSYSLLASNLNLANLIFQYSF